ncbi:MAG: hypothetical protein KAH35_00860 [Candidatus Atribacteria bacterium]|nr:hypothetical protein [Candidatus Atribacteria bacterium]
MKINKEGTINNINGKFIPAGIRTFDSKNRITIGEKIIKLISTQAKADGFQIFYSEEGDILLRPMIAYSGNIRTLFPELSGQHSGIIRTPCRIIK